MSQIQGKLSAGGVLVNDYVIRVEETEDGQRLTITRGSEVQTVDLKGGGLNVAGASGQVVGFGASGEAVAMHMVKTQYTAKLRWDGDLTGRIYSLTDMQLSDSEIMTYVCVKMCEPFDVSPLLGVAAHSKYRQLGNLLEGDAPIAAEVMSEQLIMVSAGGSEFIMALEDDIYFEPPETDVPPIHFPQAGLYALNMRINGEDFIMLEELTTGADVFPVRLIDNALLPDAGIYAVTLTADADGKYTADKTLEQVLAAYESGRPVQCVVDGIHIPLTKVHKVELSGGVTVVSNVEFVQHQGACYRYVSMMDENVVNLESLGIVINPQPTPVILPPPSENIGKLYYVDDTGALAALSLGEGLAIVDGVLTLTNA